MTFNKKISIACITTTFFVAASASAGEFKAQEDKSGDQTYILNSIDVRVTADERDMLVEKVKSNMTDAQKSYFMELSESEQNNWMNAAIIKEKKHMMHSEKSKAEAMKVNDTVGEILQADAEPDVQSDRELLMYDGDQLTKEELIVRDSDSTVMDNTITVPSPSSDAITTVACPVGTTAQPDMTCLVTGDYKPTS